MPSKTPKQAKFMRAIAHGWRPSRMKSPPSRAVAQEFVEADKKYSGGFAENRYGRGGLAAMGSVDSGSERQRPLQQLGWEEGGDVDYQVEPGVYEAPNVEEMGPALEQMFSDMETQRRAREGEDIDYTWDKTTSDPDVQTDLDDKLAEMSGPEQVEFVKPRLLSAMRKMKIIGESPRFKRYSLANYMDQRHQVHLWRSLWSKALQQQARESKGPMPTEEELNRIGVDDAGNPIMMEEEGMQRGGRAGRRGGGARDGAGTPTTTNVPAVTFPWGSEPGTSQEMLSRMGYSGPMGYIGVVSGLRQAGWTPAPGADPEDLRNTMWYPPEQTLTGGGGGPGGGPGGPGAPPPRIIQTDPASYVGASSNTSGRGSEYRKQLRKHQAKIAATLGSARGGHVNYYQEGGAVRPGHAEGPNPHEAGTAAWKYWERRFHKEPPPPPEPEAAAEEVPWWKKLMGYEAGATRTAEELEAIGEARGGRINYQTGGLAIAAPAGGVPPWISPTGTGPGYMDEPPPGYQFGGIANRGQPAPAAAPVGMAAPQAAAQGSFNQARTRLGPRGGGGRFGRAGPQRGMISRGAQPGGLAAMMQRAQAQQAGGLPPGIDPRAVAADPEGWAAHQADPRYAAQQRASGMMDRMGGPGGGSMGIQAGGYDTAEQLQQRYDAEQARRAEVGIDPLAYDRPTEGRYQPGEGELMNRRMRNPPWMTPGPVPFGPGEGIPGGGNIPPWKRLPGGRPQVPPSPGGEIMGGPRVPPNMQGYLQKMRMQNRPPSGPVGGGGNRVGMQDQQGALARAMQRGTGRAPMSRRMAFGRGAQQ